MKLRRVIEDIFFELIKNDSKNEIMTIQLKEKYTDKKLISKAPL